MNKLLTIFVLLLMVAPITVSAQSCTPDAQYSGPGIYPDTLVGLPCAQTTVLYQATITVITPTDSLYDLGPPLGTIVATIDSINVQDNTGDGVSVNGLPPGFTYVCNPPSCSWPGGATGCILLIGTPGAGDAGTYDVVVEVDAYVQELVVFGNPPVNMDKVDQYSIVISDTAPPTASATSTPSSSGPPACDGTATASGGVTYQWDDNAGAVTTPTAAALCAGTYNVAAIDANGCAGVTSVTVGSSSGIDAVKPGISVVGNSPNPFNDKTGISFELKEAGVVNFVVVDMLGKIVYSESSQGNAGSNTIEFSADGINDGAYMYNLVSGVHSVSGKMNIVK